MDNQKLIKDFILDALLDADTKITSQGSLFSTRILDSMALVELIEFLERSFHIKIAPMDIATENLDSIDKMVQFVERKKSSITQAA